MGVLQIYRHNRWGAICADNFDALDSKVVCRQLGYYGGTVISSDDYIKIENNILVWGSTINCDGTEESLLDCSGQWSNEYLGYNFTYCVGGAYAAVICSESEQNTTHAEENDCDNNVNCDVSTIIATSEDTFENISSASGLTEPYSVNPQLNFVLERAPIRLMGTNPNSGIVELYVENMWTTICDSYWNNNDATVVCRQMGFKGGNAMGKGIFSNVTKL